MYDEFENRVAASGNCVRILRIDDTNEVAEAHDKDTSTDNQRNMFVHGSKEFSVLGIRIL